MKIAIALCTRQRPGMLTACLESIQSLEIPAECTLHVALIENDSQMKCEEMALNQMKKTPHIGFSYALEQKQGISSARNASLELAIRSNPDWIAFIDDDETVAEDWLVYFIKAIKSDSADVYTGPVVQIVPDEIPIWYKKPVVYSIEHLSLLEYAATNNTMVKASYFDGRAGKYRFNEDYSFSGSGDTELFSRITKDGGIIRHVNDAVAYEVVVKERMSAKWVIVKEFSWGNNSARLHIIFHGRMSAVRHFCGKFLRNILDGFFNLLWGVLILPFSKRSMRYIVKGLKKISWSIGVFTGFTKITYDRYKKVEGY